MPSQSKNSIQIIIEAKNKAGKTFQDIKATLDQSSVAAAIAHERLVGMTTAIIALGDIGVAKLSQLSNIIRTVKDVLFDTDAGQSVIAQFQRAAEEAIAEVAPLTDIIDVATQSVGIFSKEFANLGQSSVLNNIDGKFAAIFDAQFEHTLRKAASFAPKIAEFLTSAIPGGGFIRRYLGDDLGDKLIDAFKQNEQKLANFLLQRGVSERIPLPLQPILDDVAGGNFSKSLVGFLQSSQLSQQFTSPLISGLLSDGVSGGIKQKLAVTFSQAFQGAFIDVDNRVQQAAFNIGANLGNAVVQGTEAPFTELNQRTRGNLGKLIDELARNAAGLIPEGVLSSTIGNIANSSIGQIAQQSEEKIEVFIVNRIFRAIAVKASQAFSQELEKIGKVIPAPLQAAVKKIPQVINGVFPQAGNLFAGLQTKLETFSDRSTNFLTSSPVEIATERVSRLTQELEQLAQVDIEALQRQGLDTALDNSLSGAEREAQLNRINQQIAEGIAGNDLRRNLEQRLEEAQAALNNLTVDNRADLQSQAVQVALNPELSSEEKDRIIADINRQIDQISANLENNLQTPITQFFAGLKQGVTDILGDQFVGQATDSVVQGLRDINQAFGQIPTQAVQEIGRNAGNAFVAGFGSRIKLAFVPIISDIDQLLVRSVKAIESLPQRFAEPLEKIGGGVSVVAGIRDPIEVFSLFKDTFAKSFGVLSKVGEQLTFLSSGIQVLQQVVQNGPFKLLIQQNVQLREQLLSTQSSLVSTNNIVNALTGQTIDDNTAAIKALTTPVRNAIAQLRKDSLDLVGVTSGQLIEGFQIIAGQAGEIGASLTDVKDLTIDFSAALGTLGVPLFQSRQEITSIVQGTIDMNSILAKSIGLTNAQVRQWKSQGVLIDKLREKLAAFRDGNKLAAQTVGGITSNIQEVIENIGLQAGEKLIEPIVERLDEAYQFLAQNFKAIADEVESIAQNIFNGLQRLVDGVKELGVASQGILTALPNYLGSSLGNFLQLFGEALTSTSQVLEPFLSTLGSVAKSLRPLGNPILGTALKLFVLSRGIRLVGSIFGTFTRILPGIGELLFGLNIRMLPLVNLFPNLVKQLGLGAGSFLLLGKSLNNIPGAAGQVIKILSRFVGPLAPLVAGLIPGIAGVGIQIVGLSKGIAPLNSLIQKFLASNPSTLIKGIGTALKALPIATQIPLVGQLADSITSLGQSLTLTTRGTTVATLANNAFQASMRAAAIAARRFIVNTALIGAGLFLAFKALDKFVLQNEQLVASIGGVVNGIGDFIASLFKLVSDNYIVSITVALAAGTVALYAYRQALYSLIATDAAVWLTGLAGALNRVSKSLALLAVADSLPLLSRFSTLAANSSGAVRGLGKAFKFLSFGSMAAGAGQASAALSALIAQLKAGTLFSLGFGAGLKALGVLLLKFAAGIAAVAAPITILVAGIAAIGAIRYTKKLKDAIAALEIYGKQTNQAATSTLNLLNAIKELQQQQADKTDNGIALSQEELQANQIKIRQARLQLAANQDIIKSLQAAKRIEETKGSKNQNIIAGYDQQIKDLEKVNELTLEYIESVRIQNKELSDKGTLNTQLEQRAATLEEAISNSNGQEEKFKQNVGEFIDLTGQLLERGIITAEEAERRLLLVTNNVKVLKDEQIKARQALIKVYGEEADALERLQRKSQELLQQSENDRLINSRRNLLLKSDRTELEELEIASQARITQSQLAQAQERVRVYEEQLARIKQITQEKSQETEDQIRPLLSQILDTSKSNADLAEIERQIDTIRREASNSALLTQKEQGEIEAKLRQARGQTQQLYLKSLDEEVKALDASINRRKALLDEFNRQLQNQLTAQSQGLQRQLQLYQSIEKSLSIQSQLLQARKELQGSSVGLLERQITFLAQTEKNEARRRQYIEATATIRLRGLLEAQKIEQKNLEIQQTQNKLALERELIQNRIAASEQIAAIASTQAELITAQSDPRTSASQLKAIQLKLSSQLEGLANIGQLGQLLQQQQAAQKQEFKLRKQTLENTQKAALIQGKQDFASSVRSRSARRRIFKEIEAGILADLGVDKRGDARRGLRNFSLDTIDELFPQILTGLDPNDPALRELKALYEQSGKTFSLNLGVERGGRTQIELNPDDPGLAGLKQVFQEQGREADFLLSLSQQKGINQLQSGLDGIQSLFEAQGREFRLSFGDNQSTKSQKISLPKELFGGQLPELSLEALRGSLSSNFEYFRGSVNKLVDGLKSAQGQKVNNITINIPQKIQKITTTEVEADRGEEINLQNVLNQAKLLAAGA